MPTLYDSLLTDTARWHAFTPRADDIIIATPPKSGTTWTQAICAHLVFGTAELSVNVSDISPWLEFRLRDPADEICARFDAQTHRRIIKSHSPADGIPDFDGVTYIAVYRHPIDVHFSMRRHAANMKYDILKPFYPEDYSAAFRDFLTRGTDADGLDMPSLPAIAHHYQSFRAKPGAHLFHYADLCRDPAAGIDRLAARLGIDLPAETRAAITKAVGFEAMKSAPGIYAPGSQRDSWHDPAGFFDSASHGKWQGKLTDADLAAYDAAIDALLPADDRRWLEQGI